MLGFFYTFHYIHKKAEMQDSLPKQWLLLFMVLQFSPIYLNSKLTRFSACLYFSSLSFLKWDSITRNFYNDLKYDTV